MIHTKVCKVDRWETLKKNTQVSQELRKPSLWTQVKSCLINQIRRRRTWTSEVHVTLERHCRDPIDLLVYRKILKSKNIKLLVWGILWSWVFDTKSESLNWSWNVEGLKRRTVEIRVDNLWKFGELASRREVLLYRELEIFKKNPTQNCFPHKTVTKKCHKIVKIDHEIVKLWWIRTDTGSICHDSPMTNWAQNILSPSTIHLCVYLVVYYESIKRELKTKPVLFIMKR